MTTAPRADTMQALILQEPGCLTLRRIPIPSPGPGEVLIKVEAATTCGTDLKAFLRGHPQIPMPGVLGHEYAGTIVETGEGSPFHEGQAVMGVHSAPCQKCRWCRRGQENLCETIMATKVLGSYAEYLLIPKRVADINLFLKPPDLDWAQASLLEPLACVAQAIEMVKPDGHDRTLIIGPGAIGLMFAAALRHLGVQDITLAGRNPERLAIGDQIGVQTSQLSEAQGQFDLVIECTGREQVWEMSLNYANRGGKVVLFGGCPSGTKASFDTTRLHYDQISLVSPFHFGSAAVRQARSWLLSDDFDLSMLISGERSLADGVQVFDDLQRGHGIKYVFHP